MWKGKKTENGKKKIWMKTAMQKSTNWKDAPGVAKLSSKRRMSKNLDELWLGVSKFSNKSCL
jgi:hypothetical protein